MTKGIKKGNRLIKNKEIIRILNNAGIYRISKEALNELEKEIRKEITNTAQLLAQKIIIKGKKTLEQEDVREVISRKDEEEFPEV